MVRLNIGLLELERGQYHESLARCEQASKVWEGMGAAADRFKPATLSCVGQSQLGLGRHDEALAALLQAKKLADITDTDLVQDGDLEFGLARAVWLVDKQRARPTSHSEAAIRAYEQSTRKVPHKVQAVRTWLASLPEALQP